LDYHLKDIEIFYKIRKQIQV